MNINRTRPVAGVLTLLALAGSLAACGSSTKRASGTAGTASGAASSNLTRVSVGNFPNSALTLPYAVAEDQGFFKAAGLDVQTVPSTSGPALVSALIGGTTQIAVQVPPNAFPAMQQGEPLLALPPYGRLDLDIVTPSSSGIAGIKSLAGKKIGVTARGAFTETFARYVLQQNGVDPTNVTFIAVGALATQEVALRNHEIDATVLSSDTTAAATAHGINLTTLASSLNGTAGPLGQIGLQSFWATTKGYRSSHPQVVDEFCTAMNRSVSWLDNNANRNAGSQDIATLLNVPVAVANQVWDNVHTAWSPTIDNTRWSANAKLIAGSATAVPMSQFVAASCG